ncbi:MAG: cytochrome C peroxidase [Verrucomicrobia bacterium]|nr:cytochrome C peroxidase [Verrucomicrobiota bacterium]
MGAAILALLTTVASAAELQLEITPTHDGARLLLDSLRYPLRSGETISITRLSYLLGGFALEKKSGGWVELSGQIAWMDAAARRSTVTLEKIPAGEYRALRFAVGLDSTTNKGDPAKHAADHPLNPNLNGLHWTWQSGYIFLAVEGMFTERGAPAPRVTQPASQRAEQELRAPPMRGFSYHFANDWNRTVITVPLELALTDQPAAVGLAFDLAALFNAPRPVSPARDGDSTHSREGDPIAAALRANLANAFQLRGITDATVVAKRAPVKPLYLPAKFTPFKFQMSGKFPVPDLPRDNPLLEERVALGEKLFHEPLLSRNNTQSCATCHDARHAFTDPRRYSLGVDGQVGTRHAMPLFNLAWKTSFFWDGRAPSLRAQALMPIQDHTEMDEKLERVVTKLGSSRRKEALNSDSTLRTPHSAFDQSLLTSAATSEKDYPALFTTAFGSPEITPEKIGLAIENFLLTLTSFDSKFDRAMRGEAELTADERRGFELFFTEYEPRSGQRGADCFHCHGGALFTDHQFHNNGLDARHATDPGRFKVTAAESDRGKFSTPSLRNVALTAPYMHDGRFATLEEVIAHYATGLKRSPTLDPNLAKHPDGGVPLGAEERRALVAFLRSLTDERYLSAKPVVSSNTPDTQSSAKPKAIP